MYLSSLTKKFLPLFTWLSYRRLAWCELDRSSCVLRSMAQTDEQISMTLRFFVPGVRAGSKRALKPCLPSYRPPGDSRADWLGQDHVVSLNVSLEYCLLAVPGALINVRLKGRGEQRIRGDGFSAFLVRVPGFSRVFTISTSR